MPDDVPVTTEPNADQVWERTADALGFGKPQAQVETIAPTVVTSPIESKPDEKKPDEIPDDKKPALYYPDKYKNLAEEKRGIQENMSRVHEANDVISRQRKLMESLSDPEQFPQAMEDLMKRTGRTREEIAKVLNLSTEPITETDGDELVDRKTLDQKIQDGIKAAVAASEGKVAPYLSMMAQFMEPQLLEARNKELSKRYPLVDEPEIVKKRDQLNTREIEGGIARDEILHLAAVGEAYLESNKVINSVVQEQIDASLTAIRDRIPDSGTNSQGAPVVTKKELTAEEKEVARHEAIWDALEGKSPKK